MFNFSGWGKSKKKNREKPRDKSERREFVGRTKIPYEPRLINEFIDEHKILLDRFGRIKHAVDEQDVSGIKTSLAAFAKVLRGHLLKENLKLYVYLSHAVSNDKANADIVSGYRREMQGIGKVVNDFVTKYLESELHYPEISAMSKQLEQIETVLLERISNEENVLYPLYMSPERYG